MISLKMIETIFDPIYSGLLKNELSWDIELKRNLAKIVVSNKKNN